MPNFLKLSLSFLWIIYLLQPLPLCLFLCHVVCLGGCNSECLSSFYTLERRRRSSGRLWLAAPESWQITFKLLSACQLWKNGIIAAQFNEVSSSAIKVFLKVHACYKVCRKALCEQNGDRVFAIWPRPRWIRLCGFYLHTRCVCPNIHVTCDKLRVSFFFLSLGFHQSVKSDGLNAILGLQVVWFCSPIGVSPISFTHPFSGCTTSLNGLFQSWPKGSSDWVSSIHKHTRCLI